MRGELHALPVCSTTHAEQLSTTCKRQLRRMTVNDQELTHVTCQAEHLGVFV
jgi:hypothetical protein